MLKETSSHTPAPKKGISNSKKQLNFDSNFKLPINYNLSTFIPFTPVKIAYNEDFLLNIKHIKLVNLNKLVKYLQEEEFQRLERENLTKNQKKGAILKSGI